MVGMRKFQESGIAKLLSDMTQEGLKDVRKIDLEPQASQLSIDSEKEAEDVQTGVLTSQSVQAVAPDQSSGHSDEGGNVLKLKGWISRGDKDEGLGAVAPIGVGVRKEALRSPLKLKMVEKKAPVPVPVPVPVAASPVTTDGKSLLLQNIPNHLKDEVAAILKTNVKDIWPEAYAADTDAIDEAGLRPPTGLKNLNERHHKMILAQLTGLSKKQMSMLFGLTLSNVYAITNSDLYQQELSTMRDKMAQDHLTRITGMQAFALDVLEGFMHREDVKDTTKLAVAKFLLNMGGVKSASNEQNVKHTHEHTFSSSVQDAMKLAQRRRLGDGAIPVDATVVE